MKLGKAESLSVSMKVLNALRIWQFTKYDILFLSIHSAQTTETINPVRDLGHIPTSLKTIPFLTTH